MVRGIALVGAGHWGKNHLNALSKLARKGIIDRLVLCDADPAAEKRIDEGSEIQFTTDIEDVLSDNEIVAVDLATPTSTHFELGKRILAAGKDAFIEKPLAYTTEQCDELITLAEENERILMTGHIFRYHPAVQMLVDEIAKGRFGEIRSIDIARLALRPPRRDMGVLHALAIHDIDLACYLYGVDSPRTVFTMAQSFYTEHPDEMAILLLDFGEERMAKVESSWLNPVAHKTRTLELIGSQASAFLDFLEPQVLKVFEQGIVQQGDNGELSLSNGETLTMTTDADMPLDIELKHFIDCVVGRKKPRTDGYVGRNAVRMIECAFESLEKGVPVEF